jgi:hypothetical protein
MFPFDRWGFVRSRLKTVEKMLQILLKIFRVFFSRYVIYSGDTVFSCTAIRLFEPVKVDVVCQRGKSKFGQALCQLCYPLLYR